MEIATAVRRYKSERSLSLGAPLERLQLAPKDPALAQLLREGEADITSITRAGRVEIAGSLDPELESIKVDGAVEVALSK